MPGDYQAVRSQLNDRVSQDTQDSVKAALIKTQLNRRVSAQTLDAIRARFGGRGTAQQPAEPVAAPPVDRSVDRSKQQAVDQALKHIDEIKREAEACRHARAGRQPVVTSPGPAPVAVAAPPAPGLRNAMPRSEMQRQVAELEEHAAGVHAMLHELKTKINQPGGGLTDPAALEAEIDAETDACMRWVHETAGTLSGHDRLALKAGLLEAIRDYMASVHRRPPVHQLPVNCQPVPLGHPPGSPPMMGWHPPPPPPMPLLITQQEPRAEEPPKEVANYRVDTEPAIRHYQDAVAAAQMADARVAASRESNWQAGASQGAAADSLLGMGQRLKEEARGLEQQTVELQQRIRAASAGAELAQTYNTIASPPSPQRVITTTRETALERKVAELTAQLEQTRAYQGRKGPLGRTQLAAVEVRDVKVGGLQSKFDQIDTNNDGVIDRNEWARHMSQQQPASGAGLEQTVARLRTQPTFAYRQ